MATGVFSCSAAFALPVCADAALASDDDATEIQNDTSSNTKREFVLPTFTRGSFPESTTASMFVSVRFPVSVVSMPLCGLCNCRDKPPVLHTLQANKPASEFLDLPGFAMYDEDLKAGIVVEVGMTG